VFAGPTFSVEDELDDSSSSSSGVEAGGGLDDSPTSRAKLCRPAVRVGLIS
jgi:hypothetical protein